MTRLDLSEFAKIDGMPFAFHVGRGQIGLWDSAGRFEPILGIVRKGGSTFDNFRFLRCRWEISPRGIGSDWIPYQKGGDYQPYFAPSHLVLDWRDDGRYLREEGVRRGVLPQVMQSASHWYKPGLCFPRVNKGLGVRLMPAGEIFTDKSIAVFANDHISPLRLLGLLNSTPIAALLQTFGRSRFIGGRNHKEPPGSIAPSTTVWAIQWRTQWFVWWNFFANTNRYWRHRRVSSHCLPPRAASATCRCAICKKLKCCRERSTNPLRVSSAPKHFNPFSHEVF